MDPVFGLMDTKPLSSVSLYPFHTLPILRGALPLGRGVISLPQARKRNTATQPLGSPERSARVSSTLRVVASIPQANTLNILVRLSATLFPSTLSCQCLLHSPLLTRLQVIRVSLHVPNNVLRLNLALEAAEGILQRLALLQSNFSQAHHPQSGLKQTHQKLTLLCC